MDVHEGTPWQPTRLDEFMEEPFERLREQQDEQLLERMDRMVYRLEQIEHDLDVLLDTTPTPQR